MTTTVARTRISDTENQANFFLASTGSDSNDGQTAPMRTFAALFNKLVRDWDFAGQLVSINAGDGFYDSIVPPGRITGQSNFPTGLYIRGDTAAPNNCIIQPTAGTGPAVHLQGPGCEVMVDGFRFDMTHNPGGTMVTVEKQTCLNFGNVVFGPNQGTIDIQCCFHSEIVFNSPFAIDKVGTGAKNFLQQDPLSFVGTGSNGVFGSIVGTVNGTPYYSDAFFRVDGARNYMAGVAWFQSSNVVTSFNRGFSSVGAMTIPLNSVAGITPGMFVVSSVTLWGTQVASVDPVNVEVTLYTPTQIGAQSGTPIAFGSKAELSLGASYAITNGGLILSNTNTGAGPDPSWLPGSPGYLDGRGSFYV